MGTVVEKFQYIEGTKEAIKKAIKNKGVDVSDTDTFRSYADKIKEIGSGSGGGSSVAEYFYQKKLGLVEFPSEKIETSDKRFVDDYRKLANLNKEPVYVCPQYGVNVIIDKNTTTGNNGYVIFKFPKKAICNKVRIKVYASYPWSIYATDNLTSAYNFANSAQVDNENGVLLYESADSIKETSEIPFENNQEYTYYCYRVGGGASETYELSIFYYTGVIDMVLKSANMTPSFKCFPEDYMQVITQDWYNGSEIIPSQTLTFKPYEDGGCLVNYTDDGKAVNLKMYYLKSNGEIVGNIYDNYTIVGGLTTDKETGIVRGFSSDNKIIIPETVNTDNWQFSIKANYKNTSRHQGILYDNAVSRGVGLIRNTTQTMSSYVTGSWTDGVVPLEDGADYWFLFVIADNTLTSYVKKDNGYKTCPPKEEMEVNFTIPNIISGYGSFVGHSLGIGLANSGEYWESYVDMSTASLVDDGVEVWNAATKVAKKDTYVLSPDDSFELEGYSEKTQVADLNIPERLS